MLQKDYWYRWSHVLHRLTAVVSVFALLFVILVFLPPTGKQASAFVNDPNLSQNSGSSNPSVRATMTHQRTDQEKIKAHPGDDPDFDETFTWSGSLTFNNIPEGSQTAVRVIVDGSVAAPFDSAISSSDFIWTNQYGQELQPQPTMKLESSQDGRTSFLVTGLTQPAKVSFTKTATTLEESQAHPGKFVSANLYGEIISAPKLSLERGKSSVSPELSCDVVAKYQMTVRGSGAWLMDIKFADLQGRGKIALDHEPLVNGNRYPDARNSITVTDADGYDITDQLFTNSRYHQEPLYRPQDASYPYFPDTLVEQAKPNIKFIDSMNWRYNPQTLTGDTWLPEGSTITIKRGVKRLDCLAGFATDFDPDRQLLASVEVTRPLQPAKDSASDSFYLPGAPPAASCGDIRWVQYNVVKDSNTAWGTFTLNGNDNITINKDGYFKGFQTPAVGISPKEPNRMYFFKYTNKKPVLHYVDLNNNSVAPVETNLDQTELNGYDTVGPISLSSDPQGNLWAATRRFVSPQTAEGQKLVPLNSAMFIYKMPYGSKEWHLEVVLPHTAKLSLSYGEVEAKDIVMDSRGGMYIIFQKANGNTQATKPVYLPYLTKEQIRKGMLTTDEVNALFKDDQKLQYGYTSLYGKDGDIYGQDTYGVAFGPDGHLYIAGSGNPKRVDTSAGRPFKVKKLTKETRSDESATGYDDLASCSFGDVSSPQPKFVVEKSAIDPVTGATLNAGQTSPNAAIIDEHGNTTVKYRVTISNVGGSAGSPYWVHDTFNAPEGFNITSMTVQGDYMRPHTYRLSGSSNTSTLPYPSRRIQLGGDNNPTSYSWLITVDLQRNGDLPSDWVDAASCQSGKNTGFYNKVDMENDSDGEDNNHACIPATGAQIHLYKQIVDASGNYVSGVQFYGTSGNVTASRRGEESNFTLVATATDGSRVFSGITNVTRSRIEGPGGFTKPGTFSLSEQYGGSGSYAQTDNWECRKPNGTAVNLDQTEAGGQQVSAGTITLANGDDVSCIIKNHPVVPFSVEKLATHPVVKTIIRRQWDPYRGYVLVKHRVVDNEHIGQQVSVDSNGTYLIQYRVKVTNQGRETGDSGEIAEYFKVPNGLIWDTNHTFSEGADSAQPGQARITFDSNDTDANVMGDGYMRDIKFMSEDDLRGQCQNGANDCNLLAQSVQNLDPGQSVFFDIEIPVKPNLNIVGADEGYSQGGDAGKTVFDENKDNLTSCESRETDRYKYTTTSKGVANTVTIAQEDRKYSPIYAEDNIACVPIKPPVEPRWQVEKAAHKQQDPEASSTHDESSEWSDAGGVGTPVQAKKVGEQYQVTATYRIKVTNVSDYTTDGEKIEGIAAKAPEMTDTITVPAGFSVSQVTLDGSVQQTRSDGSGVSITIPAGTEKVDPSSSQTHEVVVTYMSDSGYESSRLQTLSLCSKQDDNFDRNTGFVNTVSMPGDADGTANNQACVPVANNTYKITVKKFDAGENALPGAEFELYPDDHGQMASDPIRNAIAADATNSATFTSIALHPGTYWLKETKAPYADKLSKEAAYQLLPQPLRFVVTSDGKLQVYKRETQDFVSQDSHGFYLVDAGTFVVNPQERVINVHDPRAGNLPESGSSGRLRLVLTSMLLIVLGAIGAYTTTSTVSEKNTRKR